MQGKIKGLTLPCTMYVLHATYHTLEQVLDMASFNSDMLISKEMKHRETVF